jgi:hypothetical protein
MTTDDDTDPSTPSAQRSTEGTFDDTDPVLMPIKALRPSTHPGLGPPSDTRPAPTQPMGIVAPTAGPDIRKDSVELLLDGISGAQPARTKTTPQTDGEASAAYHSRHDVRRAHTSADEEPKVVIDHSAQFPLNSAQYPTMRIERSQLQSSETQEATGELTIAPVLALWPRVVIAAAAGLVVVLCLFAVSRLTMRVEPAAETAPAARPAEPEHASRAATQAIAPQVSAASASASVSNAAIASVSASAQSRNPVAAVVATAPAHGAGGTPPPPPATVAAVSTEVRVTSANAAPMSASALPARPRPRTPVAVPASAARDLSELKTTFH